MDGIFTMEGGEIHGNTATGGYYDGNGSGGVLVAGGTQGVFMMSGGEIYGNTAYRRYRGIALPFSRRP